MTAEEIVLAAAVALERAAIPYMTVGGLAGIYYGINRTTDDADFLLEVSELNVSTLRQALGPGFIQGVENDDGFIPQYTSRGTVESRQRSLTVAARICHRLADAPEGCPRLRYGYRFAGTVLRGGGV